MDLRVAMVTPRFDSVVGGGEISVRLLVDQFRKQNIKVDVFSNMSIGTMKSWLWNVKDDYDIFHSYNMRYLPIMGWLSKKYNVKTVSTLNGITFSRSMSGKSGLRTWWKKIPIKYIKNINQFVTICPYYKQMWILDGLDSDKIKIITNMYDPSFIPEKHIISDKTRLLFVGSRCWWRNLNLFKKMCSNKNFTYRIVGKGWGENIPYNCMPSVYANSDVLVLPYNMPVPVSRCIIEGMQSCVPVVTSGNDSFSPIIENNISGVLVDSDDVDLWSYNVGNLVYNKSFYDKIFINAKERVEYVCNPSVIVKQYIDLYKEVMDK